MRITYVHISNIVPVTVEIIRDAYKVFNIYLTVCTIGNDIIDLKNI